MSFTGTLDDLSPVEIISVLDILEKSGKLLLNRGEEEGLVVFRRGKIIYAASSGFRENLGTMLLARELVNEGDLVEALALQVASTEEKRLGNILIDMGALSQDDLNNVVLEQVIRTVSGFGHWDTGNFVFSSVHIEDHGEVELPSGDLWAPLGLSPNHVLLRIAQAMDESGKSAPPAAIAPETSKTDEPETEPVPMLVEAETPEPVDTATPDEAEILHIPEPTDFTEPDEPEVTSQVPGATASLSEFVGQVSGPQVKGELVHKLLQKAGQAFGRCLIFSVRKEGFRSIAQTGQKLAQIEGGTRLLDISLARETPSILSRCVSSGHTVMAKLPQEEGDNKILEALGGACDEKSVAMPLAVRNETVLILYGDSLLEVLPPRWAENLEGFLAESAQGIEADIQAEIAAEIAAATSA